MNKKYYLILVILIFLFAAFLRLYNLGAPSFWIDEMNHVYVTKSIEKDGSLNLPSGERYGRAKLFSYATAFSAKIFGVNEFGVRFASTLFGLIALLVLYLFAVKFLGKEIALVSLFLLALIPYEVGWARTARFYTLFQTFTILTVFTFYLGFEWSKFSKKLVTSPSLIKNWQINWLYLFLSGILAFIAISIQVIGAFILLGIFVYIFANFVYLLFTSSMKVAFTSKYFAFSVLGILASLAGIFLMPGLKELIKTGLEFSPGWAQYDVALDRFLFIKFIIGKDLFPLGVFFVLGVFQAVIRKDRLLVYLFLIFIVPIFLFTTIFSIRMFQYMYNIFPFLIIIAVYFVINFLQTETSILESSKNLFKSLFPAFPKLHKKLVYVAFIGILPLTQFFPEGIKIPFQKSGASNGAITHLEWKEAVSYLQDKNLDQTIILSTLPITIKYYLGEVDYNININDFELAKENKLFGSNNQLYDFYSGVPFIETASKLDSIIKISENGFIVADTYRLLGTQYVSTDLRIYIKDHLQEVYVSPKETVRIYGWQKNPVIG